jgi:hypothetical protein
VSFNDTNTLDIVAVRIVRRRIAFFDRIAWMLPL